MLDFIVAVNVVPLELIKRKSHKHEKTKDGADDERRKHTHHRDEDHEKQQGKQSQAHEDAHGHHQSMGES
jgi:hypothetical protein